MKIIIEGIPKAAMRPKIFGKYFYDPQAKKKKDFAMLVNKELPEGFIPFDNPLVVELEFHMPIPKHLSKKKTAEAMGSFHIKKPDLSNLIKFVEDSLNKIIWRDDSIIAKLICKKVYSDVPKTIIYVKMWE